MKKKIGLIVNPVAGMGGKVALKGTDGASILAQAKQLGAVEEAAEKTKQALSKLIPFRDQLLILTCSGAMGEFLCLDLCLPFQTIYRAADEKVTTAMDTEQAAKSLAAQGIELLLFAGGDGTARNICQAVGKSVPVLGIPAGVKVQSAVFAVNPGAAGMLIAEILEKGRFSVQEREVLDLDEDTYRTGHVSAALYGYLQVPYERRLVQDAKTGSSVYGEEDNDLLSAAEYIVENMEKGHYYAIGSGSQAKSVSQSLGIEYELLGIDIVLNGKLVQKDVTETDLWNYAQKRPLHLVVSPIGGQGFIFGRGNRQFSSRVLKKVGKDRVVVIASAAKLRSIGGRCLRTDCGDEAADQMLRGYYKVVCGYGYIMSVLCR